MGDSSSIRATTWSWPAPSAAPLPFLTGIGHERKPTILDVASEASLCAQRRPSSAAHQIRTARSKSSTTDGLAADTRCGSDAGATSESRGLGGTGTRPEPGELGPS